MIMTTLTVFDPALCCSTGVCGPDVDESLVRFAADVAWLESQGVEVHRFNLAQEPGAFAASEVVRRSLIGEGVSCLPLLVVDGEIVARGAYPPRAELARIAATATGEASPHPRGLPVQGLPIGGCAPGSGCC
jgi:hypothetical protein